jgi:hypothetical protein
MTAHASAHRTINSRGTHPPVEVRTGVGATREGIVGSIVQNPSDQGWPGVRVPTTLPSLSRPFSDMTFNAQIEDLTSALRATRARLLAPIDLQQHQLPRDPEIFVEDTLQYVMDEWSRDLRANGHVLEEDSQWKDGVNHYPRFLLRMAGGDLAQIHFTGEYPRALYLSISKGFRNGQQFSDARMVQFELPITTDANKLLLSILGGLKDLSL